MTPHRPARPTPYTPPTRPPHGRTDGRTDGRTAELEIRDRRAQPFVRLDKSALQLLAQVERGRPELIAVYVALIHYADRRSRDHHASVDQVAALAGVSRRTAQDRINQLHRIGLLAIDETYIGGRQTRNTYTLLDPPLTPPTDPPRRGRIILTPQVRDAGAAPLMPVSRAGAAPPRVQELHPTPRYREHLEGDPDMQPTHARAHEDTIPAAATRQPLPERTRAAIVLMFAGQAAGRQETARLLNAARFERGPGELHIITSHAQTRRLAEKHRGGIRSAAAAILSEKRIELVITYEAPR